jgi:putative transposase
MSEFLYGATAGTARRGRRRDKTPSCLKQEDAAPAVDGTTNGAHAHNACPMIRQRTVVTTYRLKVKAEGHAWLNAAAVEVNQVWNWANAMCHRAAYPFIGQQKWLSGYDLDRLSVGASKQFTHIGSDTIQRVNAELATRRSQFRKSKLRWRVSYGTKRSLGWVPFKAAQLKRKRKSLRFSGKTFRVFEQDLLEAVTWGSGCFAQDAVGDWWLCLPVQQRRAQIRATRQSVALDLGLQKAVATSDGDKLEAGQFYRNIGLKIDLAQRRGHKLRAKRLRRTAARRRADALHKYSRKIVDRYQTILIGDVSSSQFSKTRVTEPALSSGWGLLKTQLQYKGQQAGRSVRIVNRGNTTRACSSCQALTGPRAPDMLAVRIWVCSECGDTHDLDINAAGNILSAGRCPPSIRGNESSPTAVLPSQSSIEARFGIGTRTVAA